MTQKVLQFEQLEKHFRRSLKQQGGWTGPDLSVDNISAVSSPPSWHLSAEGLEYHKERGRGLVDVLLLVAFQAGFTAGMTTEKNTVKFESIIEDIRRDIAK